MVRSDSTQRADLDVLEGVAHHGDEHVDQHDDNGDVVEGEEEHADALHHRRGVVTVRKVRRPLRLSLVRDLHAVDVHEPEHRPEEAEQRAREAARGMEQRVTSAHTGWKRGDVSTHGRPWQLYANSYASYSDLFYSYFGL